MNNLSIFKEKNNIVFDFDLTLAKLVIDWTKWHEGIREIYSSFNPDHEYGPGINPHEFYNQMIDKYGKPLIEAVRKFNSDYEEKFVKEYIPANTLINLIKKLEDKNLYIFSSNSRKTIEKGLSKIKLSNYFKQLITRDETSYLKPNPEGFYLIENFNDNKEDFLMVGDSSSDEIAAKNAGISFYKWSEFGTYKF